MSVCELYICVLAVTLNLRVFRITTSTTTRMTSKTTTNRDKIHRDTIQCCTMTAGDSSDWQCCHCFSVYRSSSVRSLSALVHVCCKQQFIAIVNPEMTRYAVGCNSVCVRPSSRDGLHRIGRPSRQQHLYSVSATFSSYGPIHFDCTWKCDNARKWRRPSSGSSSSLLLMNCL